MNVIKKIKDAVVNCFYPKNIKCVYCDEELDKGETFVCKSCKLKLPVIDGKVCKTCGEPIYDLSDYCIKCKSEIREYPLTERAIFEYDDMMVKVIYKLKYGYSKWLTEYFSGEVYKGYEKYYKDEEIDFIVPVPLHLKRLKERGYNQSELLLDKFIKNGHCVRTDILYRIRNTPSQTKLSKIEREANLKAAFLVANKEEVKNKTILLVDDVFTTGATMEECCSVIVKSGAKKVLCLTLAKVKNKLKTETKTE